jgi:hypothetical protein
MTEIKPRKYDHTDPKDIERFAGRLVGSTLSETEGEYPVPSSVLDSFISGHSRGSLGNAVEEFYFGIKPEADGTPDFPEAWVELKTTPVKRVSKGYVAKERLVLGMIDYIEEAKHDFETSSFTTKNRNLQLMSYLHEPNNTVGRTKFLHSELYAYDDLPAEDRRIIREDWEVINQKIREGRAHELSEGDTLYLAACTKSATSANRRPQSGGPPAKPRAFSYKPSFVNSLRARSMGDTEDVERVIKGGQIDVSKTFEEQVLERFERFKGRKVSEIANELGLEVSAQRYGDFAKLARHMVGVRKAAVEEFRAAGVVMKTIQLRADGVPHQHMSFKAFKYEELINEVWDGDEEEGESRSQFQKVLESRFLFVVYRCEDGCAVDEERVFEGAFFWSMPSEDVEEARRVWKRTVECVREGRVVKETKKDKSGKERRITYFPGSKSNRVAHVRPHGQDKNDVYPLPVRDINTGSDKYTKHCFWLNSDYIHGLLDRLR